MYIKIAKRVLSISLRVLGVLVLLYLAAGFILIVPGLPRRSRIAQCMNNLYQIHLAMCQYQEDWNGALPIPHSTAQRVPKGEAWPDMLREYLEYEQVFRCSKLGDRMTLSLNRRLIGARLQKSTWRDDAGKLHRRSVLPEDVVLVFESVNDSPANNNLNGDTICHPCADRLPVTGSFVVWPKGGYWFYRGWPKWARPPHGETSLALLANGHIVQAREVRFSPR